MLTRRNTLLLALLLGLLGLEFLLRPSINDPGRGTDLFPNFMPADVGGVVIEEGDQVVHLDYKGGLWVVRERSDFYAEEFLVNSLLNRLPDLNSSDEVSAESSSHRLYGLGEGGTHVQLNSRTGEPILGFRVGRPAEESRGSYLVPDGQDRVYRAAALGMPQTDPALWLNLHLLASFDMTEVLRVEIGFADGRKLNLQRLDNGRWNAAGLEKTIAPTQIQNLMTYGMNAVLRDVVEVERTASGLDLPVLSLGFFLEKGVRRLDLGAQLGEGRAASSPDWGSDWVVEVPPSTAESLEATAGLIYSNLNQE